MILELAYPSMYRANTVLELDLHRRVDSGDKDYVVKRVREHANMPAKTEATDPLRYFDHRRDEIVATIRELVELESPSDNKAAVDRIADAIAQKFSDIGGAIRVHQATSF